MSKGFSDVNRLHARLHEDSAALFRALDARNGYVYVPFSRFLDDVESHLRTDLTIGYRLFLHHPSESIRRIAQHVLNEQECFPPRFEAFAHQWRNATEDELRSTEFRDQLETIVSHLLKRIRVEEKLVSMMSNVA